MYWSIVDIQDATDGVRFLGNQVNIPDFSTLYSKAIASIMLNISKICFVRDNTGKIDYSSVRKIFDKILKNFIQIREGRPPRSEVDKFYNGIINPNKRKKADTLSEDNAKYFFNYFDDLLNKNNELDLTTKFSIVLEIYIYFLCRSNDAESFVVALDNVERFIGTDEIFNDQLTEFVSQLRSTQQTIANNNAYLSCLLYTSRCV